jgi:hypothetical protein
VTRHEFVISWNEKLTIVNLSDAMLQSTIASSVPTATQTDAPPSAQEDIPPYYQADTEPTSTPPPGPITAISIPPGPITAISIPPGPITAISIPPAPQQPPHKDTKEGHPSPADNPGKERARDRCMRTAAVACECFCGCLLAAIIAFLGG